MSDLNSQEPDSPLTVWRPTHVLRGQLMIGAVAALAAGGLYVAADVWDWYNGPQAGLVQSAIFNLCALLPELVIVWVYWGMAKLIPPAYRSDHRMESPAAGFRGGSLCCFGVIAVLSSLPLLDPRDSLLPEQGQWALIAINCSLLLTLVLASLFFLRQARARAGLMGSMAVLFFILGWLFLQLLSGVLTQAAARRQFPFELAFGVTLLAGSMCYIAFRLWFALVKVKESYLLGNLTLGVAGAEIVNVGLFIAWIFNVMPFQDLVLAATFADGARGILLFSWFYVLRERADQEPPRGKGYFWSVPLHEEDWESDSTHYQ